MARVVNICENSVVLTSKQHHKLEYLTHPDVRRTTRKVT